jgi:N-methylhydantoinase A
VPDGPIDASVLDGVANRFHAEHNALYGYDFAGDASQQVEWVNLRVSGIGPIRRPEIRRHSPSSDAKGTSGALPNVQSASLDEKRGVCFDAEAGYVDTPVVQRTDLPAGAQLTGPVIIEEFGSTVPIHPGFEVRVDEFLNLVVTRSEP